MKKKVGLALGLLLAIALGFLLPQFVLEQAEGSSQEVTFQFNQLGMKNSQESMQEMQEVLDNIIGITNISLNPEQDSATITFDEETMKAEWIAKTLEAHGYTPKKYVKVKGK